MTNKIMIIAGEASGDNHGASLIKKLKCLDNNIEISGIGGDNMIAAGMKAIHHIKDMAFLGIVEVVKHIPFIRKVQKELLNEIVSKSIKTVVLIDYPGFNLSIARKLKDLDVKIIYYISPQLWAWGKNRVKKIKTLVDKMIVLFPFEKEFYKTHGVDAEYVGHPLVEQIGEYPFLTREELNEKFGLDKEKDIMLVLPGSRTQEITKLFPNCISAAEKISAKFGMQTVVACSENIDENLFDEYKSNFNFSLVKGFTYDLYKHSRFGIIKSGTSTLEAAFFGMPFIIVYATNWLTYKIGEALVKIKNIGLVNIVAEKKIIEELIQDDVNPDNIFNKSSDILSSNNAINFIKIELEQVKQKLGESGASERAAKIIYSELNKIETA